MVVDTPGEAPALCTIRTRDEWDSFSFTIKGISTCVYFIDFYSVRKTTIKCHHIIRTLYHPHDTVKIRSNQNGKNRKQCATETGKEVRLTPRHDPHLNYHVQGLVAFLYVYIIFLIRIHSLLLNRPVLIFKCPRRPRVLWPSGARYTIRLSS